MEKITNESSLYLKIFEYIKENGKEDFLKFLSDIDSIDKMRIVEEYIYEGKNALKELTKKDGNKKAIQFLNSIGRRPCEGQRNIITKTIVSSNLANLNVYIENARKLSDLGVNCIQLCRPNLRRYEYGKYYDKEKLVALRKQYSDNYDISISTEKSHNSCDLVGIWFSHSTWVLEAENHYEKYNNGLYKYMYMENFGVDLSDLPSREEIESKNDSPVFNRIR